MSRAQSFLTHHISSEWDHPR